MMSGIGSHSRSLLKEIIQRIGDTSPRQQLKAIIYRGLIWSCDDYTAAGRQHSVNFFQHALRRVRMVLYHIEIRDVVKGPVRKGQGIRRNVARPVINSALQ